MNLLARPGLHEGEHAEGAGDESGDGPGAEAERLPHEAACQCQQTRYQDYPKDDEVHPVHRTAMMFGADIRGGPARGNQRELFLPEKAPEKPATRSVRWPISSTASPSGATSLRPLSRRGRQARVKPSFCASFSRASAWATWRISPDRPTSAEIDHAGAGRRLRGGRGQRGGNGEIGGRLADAKPAGHVEIDVRSR